MPPKERAPVAARRWTRRLLVLLLVAAGAALALPRARTLYWLHFRSSPPPTYVVPVTGVRSVDLEPNYGAPRRLGIHEGIDILAPAGTPVLAAADGIVVDDRPSRVGGNVLWVLGSGRRLYYYAHLRRLAPGMRKGRFLAAGEPLGWVGTSGNAVGTPPHLHFAIHRVSSDFFPLRYVPIDPYPLLIAAGNARAVVSEPRQGATPGAAPGRLAIPFDAAEALALAPAEIASQGETAASRLRDLLGALDLFLGVDADVDARIVGRFYELPARLRALAAELRGMAEEDRELALRDLAPEVQEAGTRLFHASRRLTLLLDEQARCAHRELAVFSSAIETLGLELEATSTPAQPRTAEAYYFAFDGHLPNVAPAQGGWLAVAGSGLWSTGPPRVALLGSDRRRVLEEFRARRIAGGGGIAIWMEPRILAEQAGRCLFLRVHPSETSGRLWWRRTEAGAPLELPLCVPISYVTEYRVAGFLGYRIAKSARVLETDQILFSNESCAERKQVSRTLEWPLHPGGRIADKGEWNLYEMNSSSVECRIEGSRIACSGWLDPATCDPGSGSGNGRVVTEWHHIFSPAEEYPDPEEHRSAAVSPGVDAAAEEARVCVEMPRDKVGDETVMWFDLFAVNGHQQRSFFSAPRAAVEGLSRRHYDIAPYRVDADLEPGLESGEGQICVTIRSSECGY